MVALMSPLVLPINWPLGVDSSRTKILLCTEIQDPQMTHWIRGFLKA